MATLLGSTSMQTAEDFQVRVDAEVLLSVHVDRKQFSVNSTPRRVLENLHFEVERGEFVTLLGPSGCGKTTLLRLVAGLDTSFDGSISISGLQINGPGPDRGIVFQESRLLPWMNVQRNVAFALPEGTKTEESIRRVDHALQLVELREFLNAWPYQLSGGMEKRVALARALVNLPKILLLDEPFGALDAFTKYALQDELTRVHLEERLTTLLVTHDIDEAVYLSDRIAVLSTAPANVRKTYEINLPRPRKRTSGEFGQLRASILNDVLSQGQV